MDWDDVRVFLAVARSRTFLAAARLLHVNQATVARRISALEAAVGALLFERSTTGCVLTPAGERLLESAERMESEALRVASDLSGADTSLRGTIRLGAPDGFGTWFLIPRLASFTAAFPDLVVQVVPLPRSFSLSRREVDLAITVERPEEGRLTSVKLTDYSLSVYASRAYLDARGRPESINALGAHTVVTYVQDLLFSPALDYAGPLAKSAGRRFECASVIGQFEAVKAGIGLGILHDYAARDHDDLVPLFADFRIERAYWLVAHADTRTLSRIDALHGFVQGAAGRARADFFRAPLH